MAHEIPPGACQGEPCEPGGRDQDAADASRTQLRHRTITGKRDGLREAALPAPPNYFTNFEGLCAACDALKACSTSRRTAVPNVYRARRTASQEATSEL